MRSTLCFAFLFFFKFATAQIKPGQGDELSNYLSARNKATPLSGSVMVRTGSSNVVENYFGWSNSVRQVPVGPKTLFLIASCSKPLTATAVLLLVQQERLSLNDRVTKWLTGAPAAWNKITVRQLLSHTSGIPDFISLPGGNTVLPGLNQFLKLYTAANVPLRAAGTYHYSNANFILLSYIIEQSSGSPYETFMRQRIFLPLKMDDTGFPYQSGGAGIATAYNNVFRLDTIPQREKASLAVLKGAGGIYSTATDLALFLNGFRSLLSPALVDTMLKPVAEGYALGWHVQEQFGKTTARHSGGINGFTAEMRYVPADSLAIVLLSNVRANDINLRYAAFDMMKLLNGEPAGSEVLVNPKYIGKYSVPKEFVARFRSEVLEILNENGQLRLVMPGTTPRVLVPASKGRFFFYGEPVDATFDEEGKHLRIVSPSLGQIDCYKL